MNLYEVALHECRKHYYVVAESPEQANELVFDETDAERHTTVVKLDGRRHFTVMKGGVPHCFKVADWIGHYSRPTIVGMVDFPRGL